MSRDAAARVGWCPGALRPMESRDGFLLRVKPRGGHLDLAQARGIAEVARRFGTGVLDLTGRANVQIRGLSETSLAPALDWLRELGLLDPTPDAEAARNVVSSPLAGHWDAAFDVSPVVASLEARLVGSAAFHGLPAKFSFLVDDGGRLGLRDVSADIRFEAFAGVHGPAFAIRLGGAENAAAGLCAPDGVADAAEALARVFTAAARACGARRVADLWTGEIGPAILLQRAELRLVDAPRPHSARFVDFLGASSWAPSPHPKGRMRAHRSSGCRNTGSIDDQSVPDVIGVAAPFGRLTLPQWDAIVAVATPDGLRLTPWRSVLLPGAGVAAIDHLAAERLIVDAADPRLRVAACVGRDGCRRGTTRVPTDAAWLARLLGPSGAGIALHVSGCGKGCAHPGTAPVTLVGHDGGYDVVVDGRAGDDPIRTALSLEDAARWAVGAEPWEPVA